MITSRNLLLSIVPVVMALSGPAWAALSDPATEGPGAGSGAAAVIDSLLGQYAGVTPGDIGGQQPSGISLTPSQQFSSFTGAAGSMSSYYTAAGVDSSAGSQSPGTVEHFTSFGTGPGGSGFTPTAEAAPPSVASLTVARLALDPLVEAVAGLITPTSSGGVSGPVTVAEASQAPPPVDPTPTPVPVPSAALLLGSGLAAISRLRGLKRGIV